MKRYYQIELADRVADIDIYGDITSWPWRESDVSAANLSAQLAELDVDTINVNINSYGGEVAEGLAIFNALSAHKAKVRTRVDGFACSIASVIFMAGDERIMNEASLLMIHNASTFASGDASAFRKAADELELITNQSKKIYLAKTNLNEQDLTNYMDDETFIDAQAAIDMGFATGVAAISSNHPTQSALKSIRQALSDDKDKPSEPGKDPDIEIDEPDGDTEPGGDEEPDGSNGSDEPDDDNSSDSSETDDEEEETDTSDDESDDDSESDDENKEDNPDNEEDPDKKKNTSQKGFYTFFEMLAH